MRAGQRSIPDRRLPVSSQNACEHGDEIFGGAVVVDDDNQRPFGGPAQQDQQQGFGGGRQSGDTNPPRALFQVGGDTREAGKLFHVREEFANEGKKHRNLILAG